MRKTYLFDGRRAVGVRYITHKGQRVRGEGAP